MSTKDKAHGGTDGESPRRLAHAELARRFPYMFRRIRGREDFFRNNPRFDEGWDPIFKALCERIDKALPTSAKAKFRLSRAKEKFGGLRVYFYVVGREPLLWVDFKMPDSKVTIRPKPRDEVERQVLELIAEAEVEAARTCEICGTQPATLVVVDRYLQTLCNEHFKVADASNTQP